MTSTDAQDASKQQTEGEKSSPFDCNICLETVSSPVVTLCGHLYCWPCLYQWMESRSECPVCKAGISVENVIPVYGRGADTSDPRLHEESSQNGIPSRPRGQRPDPELMRRRRPRNTRSTHFFSIVILQFGLFNGQGSAFSMSPTIGFFPALFGVPMNPLPAAARRPGGADLSPLEQQQQMQQMFLSRLLLIVGSLAVLCLLMF